jgi:putative intracellular protease/amidase
MIYADMYVAYKATLSSDASLFVLPGGHGSVTDSPTATVQQLLAKFTGV